MIEIEEGVVSAHTYLEFENEGNQLWGR